MGGSLGCCRPSCSSSVFPLPSSTTTPSPRPHLHSHDLPVISTHPSASTHSSILKRQASRSQSSHPISLLPTPALDPPSPPPNLIPLIPNSTSPPPSPRIHRETLRRKASLRRLKEVKRTMFAQCLNHTELVRFSDLFELQVIEAGHVIFHQGGVADTFYLIRKGEVNMKYSDKESMSMNIPVSGRRVVGDSAPSTIFASAARRTLINSSGVTDLSSLARAMKGMRRTPLKRRAISMQVDSAEMAAGLKADASGASISTSLTDPIAVPPHPRPSTSNATHSRFFSYAPFGPKAEREKDRMTVTASSHGPVTPGGGSTSFASHHPLEEEDVVGREASSSSSFALLTTKSAGDFFGLEALRFGPHVRTCLCTAVTQTSLLSLSSPAFHRFADSLNDKEKRKKLYDLVGDSLQACLQQMPYLSGVSAAKVSLLSSLFVWTSLPSQATLFVEGERDKKGNGLYFLYEGTVGVYCLDNETGESQFLKQLTPGVCFGELGLIIHLPRTATIRAHSHCLLLHLPHRSFHNFLHLTPEILTKFKEQIESYQLNVLYLLENEVISQYFFQHCAREYSTENLEFWWEAKHYRLTEYGDDERKVEAERIMKLYITDSSPKQINLKGNTQKNILNALIPPPSTPSSLVPPPQSLLSPNLLPRALPTLTPTSPSSSGLRTLSSRPIDSQLYFEAENEIFNLLATDSFSRFKASPLFTECLEEMHVRVRKSSFSGGPGGVALAEGERSTSVSPSSSLNLRESPEASPKSTFTTPPQPWEEVKEEEGDNDSDRERKTETIAGKRKGGKRQLPSLNRSTTAVDVGALSSTRQAVLRRTNTTMRMSAQAPIVENVLLAQQKEREEAKEPETPPTITRKDRSSNNHCTLDLPAADDEAATAEGSLRYSPTRSLSANAAKGGNSSFAVFLDSRRKVATQPQLTISPPSVIVSSPVNFEGSDAFSPSARVAAIVAAKKRLLHTQLVTKALSAARGSIEPVPDSPSSSDMKRKLGVLRVNSLKGMG